MISCAQTCLSKHWHILLTICRSHWMRSAAKKVQHQKPLGGCYSCLQFFMFVCKHTISTHPSVLNVKVCILMFAFKMSCSQHLSKGEPVTLKVDAVHCQSFRTAWREDGLTDWSLGQCDWSSSSSFLSNYHQLPAIPCSRSGNTLTHDWWFPVSTPVWLWALFTYSCIVSSSHMSAKPTLFGSQ